mmetsp:Transcript_11802/g.18526  ORF Transcript_11802/g.18526 Transcript_11802/m.18526 type:complete len:206 (-) Transcript_11802:1359-1976(-)
MQKYSLTKQAKEWPVYKDLESIAKRRSRASVVSGILPLDCAELLVKRGTKPAKGGLTWTADPKILAPRFRLSEDVQKNLIRGIKCPHAVVVVKNGLFGAGALGLPLFGRLWRVAVILGCAISTLWHSIVTLGAPIQPEVGPKATLAQRFKFLFLLVQRLFLARGLEVIRLDSGGHHVHMTKPEEVITAATPWLERTNAARAASND